MRQQRFEHQHAADWARYRTLLEQLEQRRRRGAELAEFPGLHRRVCAHYALARTRGYTPGLVAELEQLVRRGHAQLHRPTLRLGARALRLMARDFPRALRRHAAPLWLAAALLFVPMAAMALGAYHDPGLILTLVDAEQLAELEALYDPARDHPGQVRPADSDLAMFGFYVRNNVGIGFRSFAAGVLFGIGSVVILVFNGLFIGAAAGHLSAIGHGVTFWPFVSGHAPFELSAIAICGGAGLLLGKALFAPGRLPRLAALRVNARDALVLVAGAALMLLGAALIEAFWSAGAAPVAVKYAVGAAGWTLLALYIALAGRGNDAS
ncbi:membrane protein [Marichromatium purpuratum 984]|uniref:Membrane protein n=1 Tax=Marichromatium purpuratum 984 TaxID=765910 RepID=W0DVQ9_MARPU|nr:stage II sporulation protein M [Marichromatium purpuratum]AHF02532.1 membrane protein [Marichromatium purpuratum 984]